MKRWELKVIEKQEDYMERVESLIRSGILQIGKQAKENPKYLEGKMFALGVANKDYPAKTPYLWNHAAEQLGLPYKNIRLWGDPANKELIFRTFKTDGRYLGGDVGVGFKDEVWKIIDEVDSMARIMESVNVIVKQEGGNLRGYNTDGLGFRESLKERFADQLLHKRIMILGAGGTGSAIAVALAEVGAFPIILNRTKEKAAVLADRINEYFGKKLAYGGSREEIRTRIPDVDAVVAAIDDPESPLEKYVAFGEITLPPTEENIAKNLADARTLTEKLSRRVIIADVMLRNELTTTLRVAKNSGFETLDGVPMVINQAIEAFWLLYGKELEAKNITKEQVAEVMKRAASS